MSITESYQYWNKATENVAKRDLTKVKNSTKIVTSNIPEGDSGNPNYE